MEASEPVHNCAMMALRRRCMGSIGAKMQIRLKRGLDFRFSGAPDNSVVDPVPISAIGLSGLDYPGLRAEFLVETGQSVAAGEALLRDRLRPMIKVTAPVSGTVTALARRDPSTASFFVGLAAQPAGPSSPIAVDVPQVWRRGAVVRDALLGSGLWTALSERPFGQVPDPHGTPDAIIVSAMAADELAPDPRAVIAGRQADFDAGIEALGLLTDGPVYVCQAPGTALAPDAVTFDGRYPAGLPGTHAHHLCPVGNGKRVWIANYQDVMAMGHLLAMGRLATDRVIALAGPGVAAPGLLRVPIGADIEELTRGRLNDGSHRILSGPALSGREAQYLARSHLQVSVLPARRPAGRWKLLSRARRVGPIIPVAAHQAAFPFDLPVVPLLRALAVGDSETAKALGCLELLEEDVAVLSHLCPSGNDYAPLLRAVLDELRRDL